MRQKSANLYIAEINSRIANGDYEHPYVIDAVVDGVLKDLERDDSDDQTRMNENANEWGGR